jgi:hypothetical protein
VVGGQSHVARGWGGGISRSAALGARAAGPSRARRPR